MGRVRFAHPCCPHSAKLAAALAEQLTFGVPNPKGEDPENPKHLLLKLSSSCLGFRALGAGPRKCAGATLRRHRRDADFPKIAGSVCLLKRRRFLGQFAY